MTLWAPFTRKPSKASQKKCHPSQVPRGFCFVQNAPKKESRLCVTTLCEVISHNGALVRLPFVIENQHASWLGYTPAMFKIASAGSSPPLFMVFVSRYDGDFPWRHVSWSRGVNVSIHLPVSQKLSLTCFFQCLNLLRSDLAGRSVYRYTCHLPKKIVGNAATCQKIAPCLSFQARQRDMQDKPSFSLILTPAGVRGKPSAWRI